MKMNRVVKIIIYALVLFLLYLWITSVAKSCNKEASVQDMAAENGEAGPNSDEDIYDEYFESDENKTTDEGSQTSISDELPETPESKPEKENLATYNENFSFEATEKEKAAAKASASAPATKSTTTTTPNTNTTNIISSSSNGKYMVIAGSYLIKENAAKMVEKLKKLGYSGAEIVSFDLSQYHSISAGKFDSYDAAVSTAREMKNKGIDCYVHTKK